MKIAMSTEKKNKEIKGLRKGDICLINFFVSENNNFSGFCRVVRSVRFGGYKMVELQSKNSLSSFSIGANNMFLKSIRKMKRKEFAEFV